MPTLTVDDYPIAYAEAGSGTPVIMVHGTLGDQRSFAGQMAAFGAQYHAIAISLRHCWPDKWREDGDFTIARHTADVAGFIHALGCLSPLKLSHYCCAIGEGFGWLGSAIRMRIV